MLFSHRQGILYVEHCRIVAADGQLSFVRKVDALEKFWSIPHSSTCCILCGPGTSITHQAVHKLSEEGVLIGFSGGGGTPLFFGSLSEYRPTEYCQQWLTNWQNEAWRLLAAKRLAQFRCQYVASCYKKDGILLPPVVSAIDEFRTSIEGADTTARLLGHEAVFAKHMYAFHKQRTRADGFTRTPQGADPINGFIDAANYMAYGLSAAVLWVLGIPHAFPVTHGNTRRGALVFDVADVIKDAMLLPISFEAAKGGSNSSEHRGKCLAALDKHKALSVLFDVVKEVCELDPQKI